MLAERHVAKFFEAIQQKFSLQVRVRELKLKQDSVVAGLDAYHRGGYVYAAAVTWSLARNLKLCESAYRGLETYPYVPGLLYVREAPAMLEALTSLGLKPDLCLVDGHGIAHPRRCGLASIIGILSDIPTIGIAKKRLVGEVRWLDEHVGTIELEGETVGMAFRRKGGRTYYASIGHLVSLETIKQLLEVFSNKYPEPLKLADRIARAAARNA